MAGAGDEYVFERWLAEGDRFDFSGERLDQPGDPLVAVGLLEPHGAVDDRGVAGEAARRSPRPAAVGSAVWIVIESPPTVARRASGVSSATRRLRA